MERKEAIEIVRDCLNLNASDALSNALKTLIPELENEDERIRKTLIRLFTTDCAEQYGDVTSKKIIAWLEKQGEKNKQHLCNVIIALWDLLDKIDTFADLQIDDTNPDNPFRKIEDITQERHKFVKSDGYNLYIKGEKITDFQEQNTMMFNSTEESKCEEKDNYTACLEKQGEKPANNVGPKFKVGDWIAGEGVYTAKIINIDDNEYEIEFIDGSKGFHSIDFMDEFYHPWTIEDAKDGDVLVSSSGCPFIYKNINDRLALFYCCVSTNNDFLIGNDRSYCGPKKTAKPATKEQRDHLFQRMTEAGYKWDAGGKKLKIMD